MSAYTIAQGHDYFIHQHATDAYGAQHADDDTKPMAVIFALIGLYLWLEKGSSGRQVQRVHMLFAKRKWDWPKLELPNTRGAVTVADVLDSEPGQPRGEMIKKWGQAVWGACGETQRERVRRVVKGAEF